jgi:broad specificity polyphosphatase/5'/3'-nucleotidase SurE
MKILVTNDDGIDSPGIKALADAVSRQPSADSR